jgi:hypothetical protein
VSTFWFGYIVGIGTGRLGRSELHLEVRQPEGPPVTPWMFFYWLRYFLALIGERA